MPPATTAPPLPDVPLDILDFAGEQDAVQNLRPVLTITRTAFPSAPIRLRLEDDPEVPDDRRIVVEVDVTGWPADELWQARSRWSDLFARLGPQGTVGVFRLRMAQPA
jgi:hypothetical protein